MPGSRNSKRWFNTLIPSLLILTAVAIYVLYPAPQKNTNSVDITTSKSISNKSNNESLSTESLANTLVNAFFNGTEEDQSEQFKALKNTLDVLVASKNNNASQVLTELQHQNMHAAVQHLIKQADSQSDAVEAAKIWVNIGNIQNLTSSRQALLAYIKASNLDATSNSAWSRQGDVYRQLKQFNNAEKAYKKVQALGNQGVADEALSIINFGLLNQSKGKVKEAEKAFRQALDIYTRIDNEQGIASANENLGKLFKKTSQNQQAEKYLLKALEMRQQLEIPENIVNTHNLLGNLYQTMKRSNKALLHYEKALEISLNNNLEANLSKLFNILGILAEENGQMEKSQIYFAKSLELDDSTGNLQQTNSVADKFANLAIVNRNQRNFEVAEDYHNKAIKIYRANRHISGVLSQQINLGFLYKVWNNLPRACETWRSALPSLQRSNDARLERIQQLLTKNCRSQ